MDARRGPAASQTRTKTAIKADGKTSPPTGKVFNLTVCTVDDWEDGAMDKRFLFWDNQSYMTQIDGPADQWLADRSFTRRSSCAFAATMIVDTLIATAPTLMGRSNPQRTSTPPAIGMETRL